MKPVKLLFNKDFKGTPNKPQEIIAYIYKKAEVKTTAKLITYYRGLTQTAEGTDLHFSLTLPDKHEPIALRKNYKVMGTMQGKGAMTKEGTPVVNYRLWVDAIELLPDVEIDELPHE